MMQKDTRNDTIVRARIARFSAYKICTQCLRTAYDPQSIRTTKPHGTLTHACETKHKMCTQCLRTTYDPQNIRTTKPHGALAHACEAKENERGRS